MDFIKVRYKFKNGEKLYYPEFLVNNTGSDLMMRGGAFYAIWDEAKKLWSTDEYDAQRLVDAEIRDTIMNDSATESCRGLYLEEFGSKSWAEWKRYLKSLPDKWVELDANVIFSNTPTDKQTYCSRKLSYPLEHGKMDAYEEIISTLYSPTEREKIEWSIGAIIAGDSKIIQKFLVLYGAAGSGKSTILNIIQMIFDGYYSVFEAKALGSSNNSFALEAFRTNPLVAIQHDGDLSRIEDNTKLNSIVSHEKMLVNEKFKGQYELAFHSFLMMGTNTPVRITDAKSGIIRRLIDVNPSGKRLSFNRYQELMSHVKFELGAIAAHCLDIYNERGMSYYDTYVPVSMMSATNDFFDFVEYHFDDYKKADKITLDTAWKQYKDYLEFANIPHGLQHRRFKEELKNYFREYTDRIHTDGKEIRSLYSGFKTEKFAVTLPEFKAKEAETWLKFERQPSVFDVLEQDCYAQYANEEGTPCRKWESVTTKLSEIDTSRLHYVLMNNENHIVVDFDKKNADGEKDILLNIKAASKFPPTYAELSKSGQGIHLHYIYSGDANALSSIFDKDVEIKVYTGKSSLRRQLTKCNNLQIATINSGLPLKEVKDKVLDQDIYKNENIIRSMIIKNLKKQYHDDTSSSINYIYNILEKAYASGIPYDVSDLEEDVIKFAGQSSNQSERCLQLCTKMHFKSEPIDEEPDGDERPIAFFDIEIFPNLFVVVYKLIGKQPVILINPSSDDISRIVNSYRLIGFNNLKYDNPMIYAAMMGYTIEQLYELSQGLIVYGEKPNVASRKVSYTDIFDFASVKQGLKKWEIDMGIHHHELGLKWDKPVPEELWDKVAEYCVDDVLATEALFEHLKNDWSARLILSDLSGCSVNETTNTHTKRIIFGKEKDPALCYTDLATGVTYDGYGDKIDENHRLYPMFQAYWDKMNDGKPIINAFPGYIFAQGKDLYAMGHKEFKEDDFKFHNFYRGEDVGFGGYVFARPGMYYNVALLDIASMHPHSALAMLMFGVFTKMYEDLIDARVAIKHHDYEALRGMLEGRLAKYVENDEDADKLSKALKIPINSVYGLTSASFKNEFKDERNVNNIVALRGALFMVNLKHEVQDRGFCVAHIKTDSIKIPNATPEIIQFVMDYGKQCGYTFEHEATYERMCLVNNAVYIAKYATGKHAGEWTATGAEFQVPFVFKTLFSHEPIEFRDMCETRSVKSAIYLDMNEDLPEGQHDRRFVGKVGLFCPIKAGCGGGVLLRESGEDKFAAVTNSTGYRWLEAEDVVARVKEDDIDIRYYAEQVDKAKAHISEFGDFDAFANGGQFVPSPFPTDDELPF